MKRLISNQKFVIVVAYVSTMLLNSLNATIVNVALATLSREFNISPAAIESVIIGYLVSLAAFMPAAGWLGDRFGTKRIFLLALAVFTAASALCGMAQSLDQLVLFRVMQGAGGGLMMPVGMAMLYRTFPPEERIGVGRVMMFATILGPALGPIIGGVIIDNWSWRWTFYVNVPVGVAAILFGLKFLQEYRHEEAGSFDLPGFFLSASGFGLSMYALMEGAQRGWTSDRVVSTGLLGLALLIIFVVVELRTDQPMVDLRLLSNRLFRSIMSVSLLAGAAFLGTLFVLPLFLQEARGESALTAGLATMPEAIGIVIATQVVALLYPRFGPRRLMAFGLVLVAVSIAGLGFVGMETSLWVVRILMFLIGVGMAHIILPNQAASMATISRKDTGGASMLYSVQRQLGSALGVALLSTVLATVGVYTVSSTGVQIPNLGAYQTAFFVAAVVALIGAAMAWFVPDEDAASTMRGGTVTREPEVSKVEVAA